MERKDGLLRRKPTSIDVARLANVSQSTVSYVLSGKRPISPETRQRVEDAIEELGFVPNSGARTLAGSRSHIIGLAIPFRPDLERIVNAEFIAEVADKARDYNYDTLVTTTREGDAGIKRLIESGLCDGLILLDVARIDTRADIARELDTPTVMVGVPDNRQGIVCVDVDFEKAGRDAIQHLKTLKHRRIGIISPNFASGMEMNFSHRFLNGATQEAERLGIKVSCQRSDGSEASLGKAIEMIEQSLGTCEALVLHYSAAAANLARLLRTSQMRDSTVVDVVAVCHPDTNPDLNDIFDVIKLQSRGVSQLAVQLLFEQLHGNAKTFDEDAVHLIEAPLSLRKH